MRKKNEMHSEVCDTFMEMASDKELPVKISPGDLYMEPNGSPQRTVVLEYKYEDKELIYGVLTESINKTFGLE